MEYGHIGSGGNRAMMLILQMSRLEAIVDFIFSRIPLKRIQLANLKSISMTNRPMLSKCFFRDMNKGFSSHIATSPGAGHQWERDGRRGGAPAGQGPPDQHQVRDYDRQ